MGFCTAANRSCGHSEKPGSSTFAPRFERASALEILVRSRVFWQTV